MTTVSGGWLAARSKIATKASKRRCRSVRGISAGLARSPCLSTVVSQSAANSASQNRANTSRNTRSGDRATAGAHLDAATDVDDRRLPTLMAPVGITMSAVEIGQHQPAIDHGPELTMRQPVGLLQQHRDHVTELVTATWVAVGPTELVGLGHPQRPVGQRARRHDRRRSPGGPPDGGGSPRRGTSGPSPGTTTPPRRDRRPGTRRCGRPRRSRRRAPPRPAGAADPTPRTGRATPRDPSPADRQPPRQRTHVHHDKGVSQLRFA